MPTKTYVCPHCGSTAISIWKNGGNEPKTIICPRGHVIATGTFSQVTGLISGVLRLFGGMK